MNCGIYKQRTNGTITVFLSLVLLIILSLLCTIIEGARVNTAKVYAERALTTAMDSTLAEYYGPLWEEYHIFGLYAREDDSELLEDQMSDLLEEYMTYTFTPNIDLEDMDKNTRMELFNISLSSLELENPTMLMDYQGELLIHEAVEYMKYREIGKGLELLLDKMSLLETPKKVSMIYEEKQKVEEELVEIDISILELMELLDGVKTGKRGIETDKNGTLKVSDYFIKKICFGQVTKEAVGINQNNIFLALKNKYVNPKLNFSIIKSNYTELEQVLKRLTQIRAEQKELTSDINREKEI